MLPGIGSPLPFPTSVATPGLGAGSATVTLSATGVGAGNASGAGAGTVTLSAAGVGRASGSGAGSATITLTAAGVSGVAAAATGWTTFTPSADTRTVYVSSSTGNNANDGLSPSTAKQTVAGGMALMRQGFPDWLLFKKGDIWTEAFGAINVWGRSAAEKMLFGAYGTGARPLFKVDASLPSVSGGAALWMNFLNSPNATKYMAIVGLEFYAHKRDPASPTYDAADQINGLTFFNDQPSFLLEDCKISFFIGALSWSLGTTGGRCSVVLRRNVVVDNYYTTAGGGLYAENTDSFLMEENVFDHNGWNETLNLPSSNPSDAWRIRSHNFYFQAFHSPATQAQSAAGKGVHLTGNIFARDSSGGNVRTGGIVENNLFFGNQYAFAFGQPLAGATNTISRNVIMSAKADVAGGIWFRTPYDGRDYTFATASVTQNIFAHAPNTGNGWGAITVDAGFAGDGLITAQNNVMCDFNAGAFAGAGVSDGGIIMTPNTTQSGSCSACGPIPTRTVATYDAEVLGSAGTEASFLAKARTQSKDTWDPRFTADAVNSYIQTGLGIT